MDTIKINREIELVNLESLINNPQTVDNVRKLYNNVFEYSNNDSIFSEFEYQLNLLGLKERDFDLYYSLSYSQGDGICIRSKKRYDYHYFTKEIIERLKDYLDVKTYNFLLSYYRLFYFTISENKFATYYNHSKTVYVEVYHYDYHSFTKEIIERLKDYLEDYQEDSEEIDDNLKEIEKELNVAFSGFYLDLCSELEDFGYKLLEPSSEEMLERFLDYYNETDLFVSSDFEIYNKKGEQS